MSEKVRSKPRKIWKAVPYILSIICVATAALFLFWLLPRPFKIFFLIFIGGLVYYFIWMILLYLFSTELKEERKKKEEKQKSKKVKIKRPFPYGIIIIFVALIIWAFSEFYDWNGVFDSFTIYKIITFFLFFVSGVFFEFYYLAVVVLNKKNKRIFTYLKPLFASLSFSLATYGLITFHTFIQANPIFLLLIFGHYALMFVYIYPL